METKLPVTLFLTWLYTSAAGYGAFLALTLLFNDQVHEEMFILIGGLFFNLVFALIFCLAFCLPLALIEKTAIMTLSRKEAYRRYLPVVTFFPAIISAVILTANRGIAFFEAEFFIFLINLFLIGQMGLWFFVSNLKQFQAEQTDKNTEQ